MSRFSRFFTLALCATFLIMSQPAKAEPKPWIWSWWPGHWDNLDFNPYLEDPPHTHNSQWEAANWTPEYWANKNGGDAMKMIAKLYKADVLRDQYIEDDIPVLVVGPVFYDLGGYDKKRVTEMVDYAYKVITPATPDAIFFIVDEETGDQIGTYTKYGAHFM